MLRIFFSVAVFLGLGSAVAADWRLYGGINSSSLESDLKYSTVFYNTNGTFAASGLGAPAQKLGFEVMGGYEWRPSVYYAFEPRLGYYREGAQADIYAAGFATSVIHHIDYVTASLFAKFYLLRFDATQFFIGIAPTYSVVAYKKLEYNFKGTKTESNVLEPRSSIPGLALSLGQIIYAGKNKFLVDYVFHIGWDVFADSPPVITTVSHQFTLGYAFSFN
jgi:hypothetical protein